MSRSYHATTFTREVLDAQSRYGSRAAWHRLEPSDTRPADPTTEGGPRTRDPLTALERDFLARLDGFYLATVSSSGWPYVQFRGGPPGFVRTPDEHTIAWDDYRGNRQYISVGNLAGDARASLIFMDYALQMRLKVLGTARVTDAHPDQRPTPRTPTVTGRPPRVEREVSIDVVAFDWNCPQHITPRYTSAQVEAAAAPLHQRIRDLEADNDRLRTLTGHDSRPTDTTDRRH
jgi:uncharacterized protein